MSKQATSEQFEDRLEAEAARLWPIDREYAPFQERLTFTIKEVNAYSASAFEAGARWAAKEVSESPEGTCPEERA